MEQLDLSRNNLSGVIPEDLIKLTSLADLDISWNSLCGRIPKGAQLETFNETSFEGNKCLCGYPLQKYKESEKQNERAAGSTNISTG